MMPFDEQDEEQRLLQELMNPSRSAEMPLPQDSDIAPPVQSQAPVIPTAAPAVPDSLKTTITEKESLSVPSPDTTDARSSAHERLWNEYTALKEERKKALSEAEGSQFNADIFAALGNAAPGIVAGLTAKNTGASVKPANIGSIKAPDLIGRTDAKYKPELESLLAQYKAIGKQTDAEMLKLDREYKQSQIDLNKKKAANVGKDKSEKEVGPTPFEKKRDEEAAKTVSKWTEGNRSSVLSDIEKLREVEKELEAIVNNKGDSVSGFKANLPGQKIWNKKGVDIADRVAGVTQKNLREILGGQFAEKEGEQLIKRAYDTAMDEDFNLQRVRELREAMELAAAAKDRMTEHAEKHGSLRDYKSDLGNPAKEKKESDENAAVESKIDIFMSKNPKVKSRDEARKILKDNKKIP